MKTFLYSAVTTGALLIPAAVQPPGTPRAADPDTLYPTGNARYTCPEARPEPSLPVSCKTDSKIVTFHIQRSVTGTGKARIRKAVNAYRSTDLAFKEVSRPDYLGSGETDIVLKEGNPQGSARGVTWCNDRDSGNGKYECDQFYVKFASSSPRQSTACHEIGHAVGLLHGNLASPKVATGSNSLGCMQVPADQVAGHGSPGSLNKRNINRSY